MQFVHQALAGAFLLTLLPLLIHLINLVRHKRVEWAAMEFLLASYKKNQRWVWLKQFLLMLLRMFIVACIVMMCAQWITHDQWLSLFGGKVMHHYILIDDTYSMSQQAAGVSAFDDALRFVADLTNEGAQQEGEHRLTLFRTSKLKGNRVTNSTETSTARQLELLADVNAERMDRELERKLERFTQQWKTTELAENPLNAVETVQATIDPAVSENRMFYLLSDFNKRDWEQTDSWRNALHALQKLKCDVQMLDCTRPREQNLTLLDMQTDGDVQAAGIPLFVVVKVKNHSATVARQVVVKVRSLFYAPGSKGQEVGNWTPEMEELPRVLFEEIPPGETVSRRVQLFYPLPGEHIVEAELPADSIVSDNLQRLVLNCPAKKTVLVIDGSLEQQHAYFVAAAFRPLERSNSGIVADVKPVSFLHDVSPETLRTYSSIFLHDVPRLNSAAIDRIKQYTTEGGGIFWSLGELTDIAYYNEKLWNSGKGIFPVQLQNVADLPALEETNTPDFNVQEHPVFSFFLGERNSFIAGVTIKKYLRLQQHAIGAPETEPVAVLAQLRTGEPLFVEKHVGNGRTVACLTTMAPLWNDWAKNPSFLVLLHKLQAYLERNSQRPLAHYTGDILSTTWSLNAYEPDFHFAFRSQATNDPLLTQYLAQPEASATQITTEYGTSNETRTQQSGIVEVWGTSLSGESEVKRWVLNVNPTEGNTTQVEREGLLEALSPVKVTWGKAREAGAFLARQSGYNRSLLVMTCLLICLAVEQWLAYAASYHPLRGVAS
jgi:uncharacterized membrane protein